MLRRIVSLLVVVVAAFTAPAAFSQMEQTQPLYTYVSQFQVPRANWVQFAEDTGQDDRSHHGTAHGRWDYR